MQARLGVGSWKLSPKTLFVWTIGLAVSMAASHPIGAGPANGIDAAAAFERLKALQGTWEAAGKDGRTARTTFELVADGTVLIERYANAAMPGGGQMLTAYLRQPTRSGISAS